MTISSRNFVEVDDLPIITAFFDQARDLVGQNQGFLHAGDIWWRYGQYEPELHLELEPHLDGKAWDAP